MGKGSENLHGVRSRSRPGRSKTTMHQVHHVSKLPKADPSYLSAFLCMFYTTLMRLIEVDLLFIGRRLQGSKEFEHARNLGLSIPTAPFLYGKLLMHDGISPTDHSCSANRSFIVPMHQC